MLTKPNDWPPDYQIKRHPRCKHVKLKASHKHGLEFIVPPKFNIKHIPSLLIENRVWIEKHLFNIAAQQQQMDSEILPTTIHLRAIHQTWNIFYIESQTALKIITRPHQELVITGDIQNKTECKKLLIKWLKHLAKIHLPMHLDKISQQINLFYKKISIRDQQTRWGSCTKDKNISLNYKIIFLPEHLASHILIHELCHTIHLNHSNKFWNLVATFDVNWQDNRNAVRKLNDYVPLWT